MEELTKLLQTSLGGYSLSHILSALLTLLVCLVAARIIVIPRLSAEEKQELKEHSLREEVAELEKETREQKTAETAAAEKRDEAAVSETDEHTNQN